jgi:uncharacterized protein (DUF2267 family)
VVPDALLAPPWRLWESASLRVWPTTWRRQLAQEIGEHPRRTVVHGGAGTGERFDAKEFVRRVSERSSSDEPQAAFLARVVFEVVDEATSGALTQKVAATLPDDLRKVTTGSRGQDP